MPDPNKLLTVLRRAATLFRATPGRVGSVVRLDYADDVLVCGDLHGNLNAFRSLLRLAALDRNPGRHLVLQELVHGPHAYPDDGGDKSHQLVDVVAALKCQEPDRVHLILGNHELSELTGRPIAKNGLPLLGEFRKGLATAYGDHAEAIYAAYHELFRSLPLAVRTPNRVFVGHTIPDGSTLDDLDPGIFAADQWSDESLRRGGAVYALTWGRDTDPATADRYAEMVDADLFVCGHQPCDEGVRRANHRTVIVDGTDPLPTALLFDAQAPATLDRLLEGVRRL